jgi:mRNA-degrading endonuclease RelE of RelBE toxin-antitoxin system
MNFSIIPSEKFKREAKKLIKKFPSLKHELAVLGKMLSATPDLGTALGKDTYKIRIAIKSKKKGKSGGARIITYIVTEDREIYLLTIYDKSEFDSIDDKAIRNIIETLRLNK